MTLKPALWMGILATLALFGMTACGGVKRVVIIQSDPPGAHVIMDDLKLGQTSADPKEPLTAEFTHYGEHDFYFYWEVGQEKSLGYQDSNGMTNRYAPVRVRKELSPPWYKAIYLQYFPCDSVMEFLWPPFWPYVDEYTVKPQPFTPLEQPLAGDPIEKKIYTLMTGREPGPGEAITKDNLELYTVKAEQATPSDRELGKAGALGFRAEGLKPEDINREEPIHHNLSMVAGTVLLFVIIVGLM